MIRTALFALVAIVPMHAAEPSPKSPTTGPATEKRFPPLKVPAGFKATLFACDPFIEYPSVIAIGPKPGTLFVAHDYMTGLGTDGVVKSEVRLIEDTDGDGYADKSTIYAKGFNSIEGLAYHNGTVFVMHAPFLTALRDTKGTGVADERKDLLEGLGLTPEKNPVRLHCANGVVVGHDGWLYLAMGDNGTNVKRPEGDRLVLNGGGILRCRRDGSDLHVFATGTRNIYDVSLDEDLNVFFRDNENDGGTYMIRVCHSFFGADHGYPYKYYERPDEALRPIGDFGLGSSAGGVCYLETQFPKEYRGNLFNCEWGKSVVRCVPKREGSGFAQLKEIEFATGAENDPYGFKPTDIIVDHHGSLLVSDWADGQRPKRGRGRIYRISYVGEKVAAPRTEFKNLVAQLDSESYFARIRAQEALTNRKDGLTAVLKAFADPDDRPSVRAYLHGVWVLERKRYAELEEHFFDFAALHADPRVRAQAVRILADITDPVLVKHRLDAGQGDPKKAERLAAIGKDEIRMGKDQRVLLEIVIALGRLRWSGFPAWIEKSLTNPDATLAHAAMMTLRKCGNWPQVLKLLDLPDTEPIRAIALRALAEQVVPEVADGLIERLRNEKTPARRKEYADLLSRIAKKPGEWTYWGYRPPPRPANTVSWEKTEAIGQALDRAIGDSDKTVRLTVLKRMQREKVPVTLVSLVAWLQVENDAEPLQAILEALREHPAGTIRERLEGVVGDKKKPTTARQTALSLFAGGLDEKSAERLLALAKSIEDGPVLAEALRLLGQRPKLQSASLLLAKVDSPEARVRAAALSVLADLKVADTSKLALKLLDDPDAGVRRAAASAAGKLGERAAIEALLKLVRDLDPGVRRASFDALRGFKEARVLPIAVNALVDPETQQIALQCVCELGGPQQAKAIVSVAKQNPATENLQLVVTTLSRWSKQPESWRLLFDWVDMQGATGVVIDWNITGPVKADDDLIKLFASPPGIIVGFFEPGPIWEQKFGTNLESRIRLNFVKGSETSRLAMADVSVTEKTDVQFFAGSNAAVQIYVGGKQVHKRDESQPYRVDSERFDATLEKGINRILIHFPSPKSDIDFHLRFRRKSSTALHEKLTQAALTRNGNVENGRKLFLNIEKSQCLKCHRVGDLGDKIGPDLTGIGNRFSRIHLIESILEPSRTIASSFQSLAITLTDGKTVIGVKVEENDKTITLGDKDGKKHVIAKADIEAQRVEKLSVMPDGLEKPLSIDEFVDLIAFMVSQKDARPK